MRSKWLKYKVRRYDDHESYLWKVIDQNEEIEETAKNFTQMDPEEDIYSIIDD